MLRLRPWGPVTWTSWSVLLLLATAIGIASLRYALPGAPFAVDLPSFVSHRELLILHATTASVALLLGPWQFVPGLRRRQLRLHRLMGRAYGLAILVAGLTAFPVATNADYGIVSSLGFMALGAAWLLTTGVGIRRAMQHRVAEHRAWMIRSYALTAAAITLRILLGGAGAFDLPMELAYPAIAWLCWVPNWIAAEVWLRAEAAGRVRSVRALAANGQSVPRAS